MISNIAKVTHINEALLLTIFKRMIINEKLITDLNMKILLEDNIKKIFKKYNTARLSAKAMLPLMGQIAKVSNLGILIVDEVQLKVVGLKKC
ncbi:hypothetical protein FC778_06905 [Clostridium botulinum]|nr:hypothetical protein [Clostridium botulinum]